MNEAYLIDCMEYMKTLPDKYFELAIVDPPYGIGFDRENTSMTGTRSDGSRRASGKWIYPAPKNYAIKSWDKQTPPAEYFDELMRVSQKQIIWGGNYFSLPQTGGWIVWDKRVTMPSLSKCELAWTSFLGHIEKFEFLWAGFMKGEEVDRIHPTQKPVKLYEWLLTHYAKQGDKILDTHLGSGSSRMACYNLGFDFVGCEIDEDYFKAQEERYQAHIAQTSLFTGGVT